MYTKANEFTMEDSISKGFAWTLEGVELEIVKEMGVEKYVREYVKSTIASTNTETKATDATIYKVWRSESGEFDAIVKYIESRLAE